MSQSIQVNGQTINYPETGDTNWSDDATNFAIQTSAALGKIGLSSGTSVDITQTLDVTGNTTLDANLSVGGNASVTGNLTVNGNTQLGNANTDTIGVTGIVNIDSGVLYVDPVNNRVGINKTNPAQALDVVGDIAVSGNETVGGTLGVTGDVAVNTNKFNVTASSGNTTIAGTLGVTGNTTLTGNLLNANGSPSLPSISFSSDNDNGFYYIGSNNFGISIGGSKVGEFNSNGLMINAPYWNIVDQKASGVDGGTFNNGAWRTRDLNTTRGTNSISGSSLASNQFTLPSGTYRISATCPAYNVDQHQSKLRNITDSSDTIIGSNGYANSTYGGHGNTFINGIFTITSQKTFEIQHICLNSKSTNGFGVQCSFSVSNIYTVVELWKIA